MAKIYLHSSTAIGFHFICIFTHIIGKWHRGRKGRGRNGKPYSTKPPASIKPPNITHNHFWGNAGGGSN